MPDTPAAPAPVDPWSLSPEQATAELARMDREIRPGPSLTPVDAQDARATLDLLSRNPSWAESLFNGNVATRKQFDELVAKAAGGDDVGDAVAGIVEPVLPLIETVAEGELPRRAVEATIAGMRDDGMNDACIEQGINLPPIPRAEKAAATALWNMRSGTAEWGKRLTSGDYQAKLEWRNLVTLLSSPIKEE
jgi:hypothetical protein